MTQPWPWNTTYLRVGLRGLVKPEGAPRPRFYFFGYTDFERERRIFFPVGVHWLVQLKRDAWFLLTKALSWASHHSVRERAEWTAYRRGYERGRAASTPKGATAEYR